MATTEAAPAVRATHAAPLAVPAQLPLRSDGTRLMTLSVSSVALFWRCPERWRRRYLERERETVSGQMIVGRAVGAAATAHYAARLRGESLDAGECDDLLVVEFDDALVGPNVELRNDDPAELREHGREALRAYLGELAPTVDPVAVERRVELRFDGAGWSIVGYLDVEDRHGDAVDLKVSAKHVAQGRADSEPQATGYLLARALEGRPAPEFVFHSVRRGQVRSGPRCQPVTTSRTPGQLAAFERRLAQTARAIAHCEETGDWPHASPDGWWCSAGMCAFWRSCEAGGAR